MSDETVEEVPAASDYTQLVRLRTRDLSTGAIVAAVGLTGVECFFSLTEGGSEINAAVRWGLTELVGAPGAYMGSLDAAAVTTYLEPQMGTTIWKAIVKPGDVTTYSPCSLVWRRPT
jgi:hypothetical protein